MCVCVCVCACVCVCLYVYLPNFLSISSLQAMMQSMKISRALELHKRAGNALHYLGTQINNATKQRKLCM